MRPKLRRRRESCCCIVGLDKVMDAYVKAFHEQLTPEEQANVKLAAAPRVNASERE